MTGAKDLIFVDCWGRSASWLSGRRADGARWSSLIEVGSFLGGRRNHLWLGRGRGRWRIGSFGFFLRFFLGLLFFIVVVFIIVIFVFFGFLFLGGLSWLDKVGTSWRSFIVLRGRLLESGTRR